MRRYTPDASDHLYYSGLARIGPFPVGDQVSQGIGIQFHDFLVPLRGPEQFETTKAVSAIPGSTEVSLTENKAKSTHSDKNQEGFGQRKKTNAEDAETEEGKIDFVPVNDSTEKQLKLGNVFEAMKQASFNTGKFAFKPKAKIASVKKAKRSPILHKFQLS